MNPISIDDLAKELQSAVLQPKSSPGKKKVKKKRQAKKERDESDMEDDEAPRHTAGLHDKADEEIVSITTGAQMTEDVLSTPRASPIETFRSQQEIRQLIETKLQKQVRLRIGEPEPGPGLSLYLNAPITSKLYKMYEEGKTEEIVGLLATKTEAELSKLWSSAQ